MKRSLRLFLSLLLITGSLMPSWADGGEGVEIPIVRSGDSGGSGNTGPHMPAIIPIRVNYFVETGTIGILFLQNIGSVSVSITNESANQTEVSAIVVGVGSQSFLVSGLPGFYTVNFTLGNGVQYYGEFTL